MYGESNMEAYIIICKIDSQWEFALWLGELKPKLCINLEVWDGEGGGRYLYLWLVHVHVWQKPTQYFKVWGCRIVWCILTSRYLVSLLPVSIIHMSDIFLVGFWSWEISFIMWGCRGWGWQAAGTWVSVFVKWWDSPPPSGDLEPANQYAPSKSPRESWKARGRLSLNKSLRRFYQ